MIICHYRFTMTDIQKLDRILTSRGYAIKKESLTPKEHQMIRQELTVTPNVNNKFGAGGQPFCVYYESESRFYLPRHWARDKFGQEQGNTMPEGNSLPTSLVFQGKPYEYQTKIVDTFMEANGNGLICVPCGKGKTFMALCIAAKIGKRFMVVVDKEFFLQQWKAEMELFFPGLRVGILQGNKAEVEPEKYDCTICMIQTLVQRNFPTGTFQSYGFTIFDECHHLGAANFSQALLKIQTKHMLGLSATPTREDGLTKVFLWYLGNPVYWEKVREADPTVNVRAVYYTTTDTSYSVEPTDYKGEVVMARLLGQVTEHLPRTQAVGEIVMDLVKDKNRRVLILSERKVMLEALEAFFADTGIHVGYYIGGMKEKDRNHAGENAQILLGTYSMASEGMSIKTLNTIVLASPRKKVEQSVGRILRQRPEERTADPLIVDILDRHGIYQGQYRKRRVFYKQCGYKIQVEKIGQGSEGNEGPEEEDSDHEMAKEKPKKAKASKGKPAVTDFDFVNDSEEDA